MKRKFACAVLAALTLTLSAGAARAADQPPRPKLFVMYSPAVKAFGFLPERYANHQGTTCAGQNVSLPLHWQNVPDGTKSFALTMVDPVPRAGMGFVHWVAYDVPSNWSGLKEGEANNPKGFVDGKNGTGQANWSGPCPPAADYPHPYIITLIATDLAPGTLKPDLNRDELEAALQGHSLGVTTFIARYREPEAPAPGQ